MKNLDERLRALPEIAEETGVTADEKLRQRILHAVCKQMLDIAADERRERLSGQRGGEAAGDQ